MSTQSFIMNLPLDITTNILTKLPTKTIATCKCVCKKWLKLISTPQFSKSHLLKSAPGLVVQLTQGGENLCRFYEFEDVIGLQHHDLHYNPLTKFNPDFLTDSSPKPDLAIECSVNGLLCLSEHGTDIDTIRVCNPITRDYINLSGLKAIQYPNVVTYGFGITSSSSQYKVVRISHEQLTRSGENPRLSELKIEFMIYTLGTRSWRNVEPKIVYEYSFSPLNGAFLDGSIHWLAGDANSSQVISCLDLETELFKPFASPPYETFFPGNASVLTVLGECLCICDYSSDDEIVVWIMKDYGVEESWTKEYVICKYEDLGGISYESVTPLKVFKNGDMLMLWESTCLFYHCKETETNPEIGMFERDENGRWYNALLYTPSFVSLRSFDLENVSSF